MKTARSFKLRGLLIGMMIAIIPNAALGQNTAISYQGRLDDAGAPANGLHDLRFRLFDSAAGGTQIGSTLCFDGVNVVDGLFSVRLDFGQQFVTTGQRHLDIQVRREIGQPCTDDFGYTLLTPRQQLTAAPFANQALFANQATAAFTLSAPDGSPANAVVVSNTGNVGIGTTNPGTPLHIVSTSPVAAVHIASPFAVVNLQDTGANANQTGYVSYRNGTGTETAWAGFGSAGNPDFSVVNARAGGDIVLNALSGNIALAGGNVGIGTTSPASKLEVRGDIRLGPVGQYRAPAGEENLRIIRGTIGHSGGVLRGSGFTAQRLDEGKYVVTFTTPFADIPTVTATGTRDPGGDFIVTANIDAQAAISTSQVTIVTWDHDFSDYVDSRFDFIAIGPR